MLIRWQEPQTAHSSSSKRKSTGLANRLLGPWPPAGASTSDPGNRDRPQFRRAHLSLGREIKDARQCEIQGSSLSPERVLNPGGRTSSSDSDEIFSEKCAKISVAFGAICARSGAVGAGPVDAQASTRRGAATGGGGGSMTALPLRREHRLRRGGPAVQPTRRLLCDAEGVQQPPGASTAGQRRSISP